MVTRVLQEIATWFLTVYDILVSGWDFSFDVNLLHFLKASEICSVHPATKRNTLATTIEVVMLALKDFTELKRFGKSKTVER